MSETETDAKKIEELKTELRSLTSKNRWLGKGGLWGTFRAIGKPFYNDKDKTTEEKKAQLKTDIEAFVNERLS